MKNCKKLCSAALSAVMLLTAAGCGQKLPADFGKFPEVLPAEELDIPENAPAYKCKELYFVDGRITDRCETTYDDHGKMISQDSWTTRKYAREYDAEGNTIKEIWYSDSISDAERVILMTYNPDGTMHSTVDYFRIGEGELTKGAYYEDMYDSSGNKIGWVKADPANGVSDIYSYDNVFDAEGRIIKKTVTHTRDESDLDVYTYTYDDSGNILSEKHESSGGETSGVSESLTEYEYDSSGNLIREVTTGPEEDSVTETVYEYDDQDRLIRKSWGNKKYTYEYEELDN